MNFSELPHIFLTFKNMIYLGNKKVNLIMI